MARIRKRYIFIGVISLLIFIILFFASDFTKNYLVKNSEKLIGRKFTVGELHFNYAKVAIKVKDLVLFEANQTDSFASFAEFYINLNPWALPSREYSVSEIRLVNPRVQIIQDIDKFNFDSLIPKEDSLTTQDTTKSEALKFTIKNIKLVNGKIIYNDLQKKNLVEMKNLNLDLPLISWNNEQSNLGVDFVIGEKGKVNIQANVDNLKKKYQIDLKTQDIDIQPITGYLTDYLDVKAINGFLSSNVNVVGDMNEVINILISGKGTVTNFSLLDGRSEKIISSPKVSVGINEINLKTFNFAFGKIEVDQTKLLVIRDKTAMNIMQFFGPYFRNDSIASASTTVQETSTPVTYRIDTIKISNALISITDNTLNRPFNYELNDLNVTMTGLSESAAQIPVAFSTKLNNRGELSGKTVWSMVDFMNIEMDAKVKRMELVSFSPYSEYYIASPITQGWLNYDLGLKMTQKSLKNTNNVKVEELEFGKKTKDTTAMKVPVRLGLYLMKDAEDNIAFEIPVEGNPSEPKFKLGKIIWKTFANLMVKTALSPFKALAGLAGANPETMDKLPFTFAQDSLNQSQREDLSKLAAILKKKPELNLSLTQTTDPEKEKAQIAIQLTKADFIINQPLDPNSPKIKASEIKDDDANLLAFIGKTISSVDSIGIESASLKLIASERIESRFNELLNHRNQLISEFFIRDQGIPQEAIQISIADLKNLPQELKVPQFKIEVSIK